MTTRLDRAGTYHELLLLQISVPAEVSVKPQAGGL